MTLPQKKGVTLEQQEKYGKAKENKEKMGKETKKWEKNRGIVFQINWEFSLGDETMSRLMFYSQSKHCSQNNQDL